MSIKNVIIIGAGGNLGPSILSAFTSDAHFTVSVLARQSSKSTFPPEVTVHRISDDYPEAELIAAFKGQDAVISTITHSASGGQKPIIDAAIKAGVKRFVPSEFGSNTGNANATALLPGLFGEKVEIVNYLKEKEGTGLTWSAFVTGAFFDWGMKIGFLGFDLATHKATIFNDGTDKWATSNLAQIGLAVKKAMLVPEKTANMYLYVESFTVSQKIVLESLEKATGEKWDVTTVDAEATKSAAQAELAKGNYSMPVFTDLIRYVNYVHGHGSNYVEDGLGSNELLSLKTESLDETIAKLVKG
ncbi:hypothetical protein MMC11_007466 [Xylographa trunciseda]|nr:hypothetical protein [Xylographa trunciseda]